MGNVSGQKMNIPGLCRYSIIVSDEHLRHASLSNVLFFFGPTGAQYIHNPDADLCLFSN